MFHVDISYSVTEKHINRFTFYRQEKWLHFLNIDEC